MKHGNPSKAYERAGPCARAGGGSLPGRGRLLFEGDLVDVAPFPMLTRLQGCDDRVMGLVEMLRRVLVLRRIAASDVTAGEAESKMDPGITCLQALLAPLAARYDLPDLVEMGAWTVRRALCCHRIKGMKDCRVRRICGPGSSKAIRQIAQGHARAGVSPAAVGDHPEGSGRLSEIGDHQERFAHVLPHGVAAEGHDAPHTCCRGCRNAVLGILDDQRFVSLRHGAFPEPEGRYRAPASWRPRCPPPARGSSERFLSSPRCPGRHGPTPRRMWKPRPIASRPSMLRARCGPRQDAEAGVPTVSFSCRSRSLPCAAGPPALSVPAGRQGCAQRGGAQG